ncbi:hypothetical protein DYB32_010393, partial [Aphanomyces invadans]
MPVRACTEPATKQRIAEWDTGKDPEDVMDDECFAWFMLAYQVDPLALDSLKRQIKAVVVFDMSITDADPRIGMLDGMSSAIRRNCQDWVIREESAAIVKIIVDDIKPTTLHRAVAAERITAKLRSGSEGGVRRAYDDIDEDEGMCYARPDLSGSADTAQVKSLL